MSLPGYQSEVQDPAYRPAHKLTSLAFNCQGCILLLHMHTNVKLSKISNNYLYFFLADVFGNNESIIVSSNLNILRICLLEALYL